MVCYEVSFIRTRNPLHSPIERNKINRKRCGEMPYVSNCNAIQFFNIFLRVSLIYPNHQPCAPLLHCKKNVANWNILRSIIYVQGEKVPVYCLVFLQGGCGKLKINKIHRLLRGNAFACLVDQFLLFLLINLSSNKRDFCAIVDLCTFISN